MTDENKPEKTLWLLRGDRQQEGWRSLEADSRADKVGLVIFDRGAGWALLREVAPPTQYNGMIPEKPKDGLYVSEQGYPIYVVNCREVRGAKEVIDAVGGEAKRLLDEMGDADAVLQRVGLAY